MKTILIDQPYASLICAGIQTEIFLDSDVDLQGEVLICSNNKVFDDLETMKSMPRRQYSLLSNAMTFDALPAKDQDIVSNHIIGIVVVSYCYRAEERKDSIWYKDGATLCYEVKDAMQFDCPIPYFATGERIFDIPEIEEDSLPNRHTPFRVKGWKDGKFYFIQFKDESLESMLSGILADEPYDWHSIEFSPQPELELSIADRDYVENEMKYLCFVSDKRIIVLDACMNDGYYDDDWWSDKRVSHEGDPDYFVFSFYWDVALLKPQILSLEEFRACKKYF